MAENLASKDGRPVLDLVVGREVQVPEFSFSWYGTGGGGRRGVGRGGLAGQVAGTQGSWSEGGSGARRFLLLVDVEQGVVLGLAQGVEVLLWDRTLFCTITEWDPSNRQDQLAASFSSSAPIRKWPSVSSILLWIISVILSNLPGELIPTIQK